MTNRSALRHVLLSSAFVLTLLAPPGVAAAAARAADCPAGWFCFWSGTNYSGARGKLSSCGRQDLVRYGWGNRVDSAYYDLNNGSVTFYDRVVASDPNDDRALFTISAATRGDPDTAPHRDKADYVYRSC